MTPTELKAEFAPLLADIAAPKWTEIAAFVLSLSALALTLVGILVGITQIRQIKKQMQIEHVRALRSETLSTVRFHIQNLRPEFNKAKSLFEGMSVVQLERLYEGMPVTLEPQNMELAKVILSFQVRRSTSRSRLKEQSNTLSIEDSMYLRSLMINFLNHIETCILPWQLSIADKNELTKQLRALVDPRKNDSTGKFRLEDARKVVGEEKFPATMAFIKHLRPEGSGPDRLEELFEE